MTADTIQKIADDLEGFILLSDQQRKTLVDRLRALSARASAGEGGDGGEVLPCHAPADCLVSEGPVGYRLQGALRDNTILALRDAYRSGSNRYYYAVGKAADRLIAANTAAPQPAQAGASGGGEDWRETERLRLLKLRQLLEGFEVEIEAEGLESPATYLDRVTLVGRFQPSAGGPEVAKRIAAILAAPVRDATPASPATGQINTEALCGMFRALVDAGGATTVARHGVERGSVEWAHAVTVGMLAIERYLHPERFELDDFPSGIAAAPQPQDHIADADKMATPPAHGDGEGDSIDEIVDYLDAVIRGEYGSMALHNSIKRTRDRLSALTTHPTPEAEHLAENKSEAAERECKCGVFSANDPHTDWCPAKSDQPSWYEYWTGKGRSDIANDYGAFQLAEKWAAALALPAQGEGKV